MWSKLETKLRIVGKTIDGEADKMGAEVTGAKSSKKEDGDEEEKTEKEKEDEKM